MKTKNQNTKNQNTKKQNSRSQTTESKVGRKKNVGRRMEKNPIQRVMNKAAVPQKLNAVKKQASRIEPTDVAKGAAAISIAAGVVAAGVALMDKDNRKKVGKTAEKGMEFVQDIASDIAKEAGGKYQAVAQSVPLKQGSSKKQKSKGRSKKS